MRAKVKTRRPISARSRRPTTVCGVDAVEELARFGRRQDRGLAGPDDVFGAAHRGGGIYGQDLADHQPVEQHADGGQPLLDGRRRKPASEALDPGGDVHGLDVEQTKAGLVAPVEEFAGGAVIGFAGVRVADVGGEEFDEAAAGVRAARGDHRRHGGVGRGQKYGRKVVEVRLHGALYSRIFNE